MTGSWARLFMIHSVVQNVFLRVTLPLLDVSVREVSAGTDCDLQAGGVGVEGQGQLQFSGHRDALKETKLCAGAAAAALRERNTGFMLQRKWRHNLREVNYNGIFEKSKHQVWLTLCPPECSELKEVSSSAPVEEPSWSLSLLFLNRFGRLGTLKSCTKKGR